MSFKSLLRIDEDLLGYEDRKAFDFCEQRWERAGRPKKKWDVVPFIESLLKEFIATDLPYPRVLLLRKKEIQRGTFTLNAIERTAEPSRKTAADTCAFCRGAGFRQTDKGGYVPCSCGAGAPHRARLESLGLKSIGARNEQPGNKVAEMLPFEGSNGGTKEFAANTARRK
jgi:hypothetical protein